MGAGVHEYLGAGLGATPAPARLVLKRDRARPPLMMLYHPCRTEHGFPSLFGAGTCRTRRRCRPMRRRPSLRRTRKRRRQRCASRPCRRTHARTHTHTCTCEQPPRARDETSGYTAVRFALQSNDPLQSNGARRPACRGAVKRARMRRAPTRVLSAPPHEWSATHMRPGGSSRRRRRRRQRREMAGTRRCVCLLACLFVCLFVCRACGSTRRRAGPSRTLALAHSRSR